MTTAQIVAILVFIAVMGLIISEKIHRCLAALLGAMVLFAFHVIDFEAGVSHIDWNTLGLLLGMMLFVAVVKDSGFFEFLAIKSAKLVKGRPWHIMIAFIVITAVLSALLDNVTTVLLIGPMTLIICRILEVNPIPFFMAEVMASNIGGTATLIGDPPNIMLGSAAHLDFIDFIRYDTPAVLVILAIMIVMFWFIAGRKMVTTPEDQAKIMSLDEHSYVINEQLFRRSAIMLIVMAVAFAFHGALGWESSTVALLGATVMMLIGHVDIEHAVKSVEWTTIGFFGALFIVVGGRAETGVIDMIAHWIIDITDGKAVLTMLVLLWASALISSFLDNIPFVAAIIPVVLSMQASGVDVTALWWAISLGACLGGNGTMIGASANVTLMGISAKEGYPVSFLQFMKVGMPVMIMSVAVATVYLLLVF
ncbi:MAG: ArsB/NhaD family transporter [Coriobacteriales bacterium]|nr:ArsB/NhaD family transporter [Coriobacteriales bacterium]